DDLDLYIKNSIAEIPENQKYLITAHDAFAYYGHDYGIEVVGIQGISTQSEAATSDIKNLADLIVDKKIKSIFIETSVPTKTIESLRDSVKSKGFDVTIGGELFSDSLGDKESGADTYIKMVKKNTDTLKNSLK
ncbi:MAG: zinc ABC transporter solute-binding protein, partial [Clostridium sp.]|nr:zinc ABC transporter solute-binding protein [Clostridium sp.]